MKRNDVSKLEYLQLKRKMELKTIELMKKQLCYDPYLLKNDLYLINHKRELDKIERAIKDEKVKLADALKGQ